jgi:NAD(P)-dependent dehydrogenase (short-subunit alcohol dehydrogenase family)
MVEDARSGVEETDRTRAARDRFSGGTAVVTGGAQGIGEGFVRHLSSIGMDVVIADLDGALARRLATELSGSDRRVQAVEVDVAVASAVEDLAERVFAEFGSVELLINNAGIETGGLLWEVPVTRWDRLMSVNLDGIFYCVHAFLPRMIASGRPGVVANLSSVGGLTTAPLQAPYLVSKHAVLALTECLHQEVALTGAPVQVSVVLPYMVRSQIFVSAEAESPLESPAAQALFRAMQADNVRSGLDPVEAARHMVASIAAGDFWVFSDDARGRSYMDERAKVLSTAAPPRRRGVGPGRPDHGST